MTLRFDVQETAVEAQTAITTIRALAIDAVERAGCGHPGLPLAMAPLAYVLYGEVLKHDPADPAWPDRDRFILSAGHGSMLLYAVLHLAGYDLALDELRRFRQWGSRTPGHPERHPTHGTPGVETTTGPLGQGFANGVGMAMAERFLRERYGEAIVDHRTYALCSDGDLMEGVSAEAASLAGHLGLGRLIYLYDDNRITIDGSTALAFSSEDVDGRFRAYGWHVQVVGDANDLHGLRAALAAARAELERPSLIRVRSVIGWPAPTKAGTPAAHGAALGADEARATKERLGIDPDAEFVVPAQAYDAFRPAAERGAAERAAWSDRADRWRLSDSGASVEWDAAWAGRPTGDIATALPRFDGKAGDAMATRTAAGKAMAAFGHLVPTMVGGAADLAESTKTVFAGEQSFSRRRAGRNVHWGVREHAMGAAVNGLALHGGILRPYGATFLAFADYMRPAIRLSALMRLRVAWVFTHDSVGLGEDGPTHQPVEHLAALRAVPGLVVLRPADAVEAADAWRVVLEDNVDGPVCLVLTRQDVPILDRTGLVSRGDLARGGYVVAEAPGGDPEVILVASGSEVAVTLEARSRLARDGVAARVVSMPSFELFEAQDEGWRDTVLPPAVSARVCIEAGTGLGWERYAGPNGEVLSIERFGASAPGAEVLERLGVTPHDVVRAALASLGRDRHGSQERSAAAAGRWVATHT
jgi:transketolase